MVGAPCAIVASENPVRRPRLGRGVDSTRCVARPHSCQSESLVSQEEQVRLRWSRSRPGATFTSPARIPRRPSRPLWLRVALSLPLVIGIFAVVGLPHVLGDGSVNLE